MSENRWMGSLRLPFFSRQPCPTSPQPEPWPASKRYVPRAFTLREQHSYRPHDRRHHRLPRDGCVFAYRAKSWVSSVPLDFLDLVCAVDFYRLDLTIALTFMPTFCVSYIKPYMKMNICFEYTHGTIFESVDETFFGVGTHRGFSL